MEYGVVVYSRNYYANVSGDDVVYVCGVFAVMYFVVVISVALV